MIDYDNRPAAVKNGNNGHNGNHLNGHKIGTRKLVDITLEEAKRCLMVIGLYDDSKEKFYKIRKEKDMFEQEYAVLSCIDRTVDRHVAYFSDTKDMIIFPRVLPSYDECIHLKEFFEIQGFNVKHASKTQDIYAKKHSNLA